MKLNVVLFETEEETNLFWRDGEGYFYLQRKQTGHSINSSCKGYHIYITDEDKKIENVFYNTHTNRVGTITDYLNATLHAVIATNHVRYIEKYNLQELDEEFYLDFVKGQGNGFPYLNMNYSNCINFQTQGCSTVCKGCYKIDFDEVDPEFKLSELKPIFKEIMNLGMDLRQNQLAGYATKSGNEVLHEYLVNRFNQG